MRSRRTTINAAAIALFIVLFSACKVKTVKTLEDQFYEALFAENIEDMKRCMAEGIDITAPVRKYTPLIAAASDGKYQSARFLLEHGADPNFIIEPAEPYEEGFFLIKRIQALDDGRFPSITRLLLDYGANPNNTVSEDASILMMYIQAAHLNKGAKESLKQSIKILLDSGADPYFEGASGFTPMVTALTYNLRDVVDVLLDHGVEPSKKINRVTLTYDPLVYWGWHSSIWRNDFLLMANFGYEDLIMRYIENKTITPDFADPDGWDIYGNAARSGNPRFMRSLLPYLEDINSKRYSLEGRFTNISLLYVAKLYEEKETERVLLEHGIDTSIEPEYPPDVDIFSNRFGW